MTKGCEAAADLDSDGHILRYADAKAAIFTFFRVQEVFDQLGWNADHEVSAPSRRVRRTLSGKKATKRSGTRYASSRFPWP